jgi:thioesterase domain-containing protein
LAHEVAQQLHALGEKVALLVLFDTQAWSLGSYFWRRLNEQWRYRRRFNLPLYHTPWLWDYFRTRLKLHLRELQHLQGSERLCYLLDKAAQAVTAVPYSLRRQNPPPSQQANPNRANGQRQASNDLDPAEKDYYFASHRHRYRRYKGRIALLVNEEWHASDPTLGWSKFAAGGLDIYKIPGNHDACIPENIPLVATILCECLKKVDTAFK